MRCQVHSYHDKLLVNIDYLGNRFDMYIYDYKDYTSDDIRYWCPANDIVSKQIFHQGNWEEYETALVLDILRAEHQNNLVVDFGSQVGWYSMLSLANGYDVISYETDEDSVNMLRDSAYLNGFSNIEINNLAIDSRVKQVGPEEIRLFKCDIEGEEQHAFRMYKKSFENKLVDYAIFEISPVFNDSYTKLVEDIVACGYSAYVIPDAGSENAGEYLDSPLINIQTRAKLDIAIIDSWHQKNVLFVKDDCNDQ